FRSHWMAAGPFSTVLRTAPSWHRKAPAMWVSRTWDSSESALSSTAATPPWAYQVLALFRVPLDSTATSVLSGSFRATVRPAAPLPIIRTSWWWMAIAYSLEQAGTRRRGAKCNSHGRWRNPRRLAALRAGGIFSVRARRGRDSGRGFATIALSAFGPGTLFTNDASQAGALRYWGTGDGRRTGQEGPQG